MTQAQFDLLEQTIRPHVVGTRTESVALLAWFLQNVWRMEPEDVDDSICDGSNDKGIDALTVDDDLGEITIFQTKHRQSEPRRQSDVDLTQLVGTSAYFESTERVDRLLQGNPNDELAKLLIRLDVRQKVANGAHAARLVFVTNAELDQTAVDYIHALEDHDPPLDVWDRARLAVVATRTQRPELLSNEVTLQAKAEPTAANLDADTRLAVALVPATELVALPGIDDLSIFDPNVRLGLGRTRINRELADTITSPDEHALFPAFHNGLTMLTHGLEVQGDQLILDGVSVVNGCQSLLTLYENQAALTPDLSVLVKAIQVDTDGGLPDRITYRTNNQNSVDIRDQRSRDPIQRDLQGDVRATFGAAFGYAIRRGDDPNTAETLGNESAAQMLMAVYIGEPWNAVRKVRLFDADYHRIFNRSVNSYKLYLLYIMILAVEGSRDRLRSDLASSFSSVRFALSYLVTQVLRETDQGNALLDAPDRFLPDLRAEVEQTLTSLAQEVAESINTFVENEEQEADDNNTIYDPKVAFKSRQGVQRIEAEVLRLHRRLARTDPDYLFQVDPVR